MRKIKTAPLIPNKFEVEEISSNEMNLRVSPFEVGFAISVAHPLKRLLMSSSIGYAPIAIKVENASHEFDNISGMLEDVSALIINLKSIRFKLKNGVEKAEVSYSFKGSKEIYGSDLNNDNVEVVTPENFLATLNEDGQLDFTLVISRGIGYVPSEDIRAGALKEYKDYIPLDAYFTPVRKANYTIENVLVEDNPNFEEIVFNVVTDGQASPREVFGSSLKVLQDQLSIFQHIHDDSVDLISTDVNEVEEEDENIEEEPPLSKEDEETVDKLLYELKDCGLKPRVANALIASDYKFVGDVTFLEDRELKDIKNFGAGSIADLKSALEKMKLDRDSLSFVSERVIDEFRKRAEEFNN
jgi:DNA-directed RNA polymerase subunit alpha